jgi:hypothetical protein
VTKLINYIIRWYGHVLRESKEETSKEVLNMKTEGKYPIGRETKMRKQDMKDVRQKEEHGRTMRRNSGKKETGRHTWLLDNPHKSVSTE